jgi:glycosyltransferase involved in cell wall biosynthesis
MTSRNLFIFCADAFPGFGGAAARFNQIASGLLAHGWQTTLIRGRRSSLKGIGAEREFPGEVICTPFAAGCWPNIIDRKGLRMLYRKAMCFLGKKDLFVDPSKGWAERVQSETFVKSLSRVPDIVMGVSFGGVGSLYAAKVFASKVNAPFFIELQDPCPGPGKTLNDIEQRYLDECIRDCAGIITTTNSYASLLKQRYEQSAKKIFPLHLSFEESGCISHCKEKKPFLTFLHAGVLYGKSQRNADAFLWGLKKAFEKDPSIRKRCRFQLLGGWLGAKDVKSLAERLNISDAVDIRDGVPYAQSIEVMNEADVLLVIKFPDQAYGLQIPGKLFQYFGRNKPILGIMGSCEAADLIRDSGLGKSFEHTDIDGIANFIRQYASDPDRLRADFQPNHSFIQQFSVSSMAKRLNSILMNAIGASD